MAYEIIYEVKGESVAEQLLITAERENEIDEIMEKISDKGAIAVEMIAQAAQQLDNPNELVYAALHVGAFLQQLQDERNK